MTMNKVVQPKYYSKFQCDPIKCSESCCERWKIIIDKNTYLRYLQCEQEIIKGIVEEGLAINETSVNDGDFAVIHLNNEMMCPFLNQDNLCEVFIHMGEESLSKTCKSYPRAITLVNDVIERGLEMSCSVAAELALLNEKGIEFEHVTDTIESKDFYIGSPTLKDLKEIEMVKEIRTTVIELLQTRTMKLSERIVAVGYFLDQATAGVDFSVLDHDEVRSRFNKARTFIDLGQFKTLIHTNQSQERRQFEHLNTLLSLKFREGDSIRFFSKRYIECLMQVLDAFGRVKEKELDKHYRNSYEKYLKPYLDRKSYILENFLVNYVFIYGIELFKLNDIWISYLKLCVVYGLFKFNLVGLAAYHKGMNDDLALKLIQSLSKTIITDRTYLDSAMNYLDKAKLGEFTQIVTLIED